VLYGVFLNKISDDNGGGHVGSTGAFVDVRVCRIDVSYTVMIELHSVAFALISVREPMNKITKASVMCVKFAEN